MTALRRFRAEASVPGDARIAAGHRRLQAGIARTRSARNVRRQFTLAGAVASVVATAMLSALVLRHEDISPAAPHPRAQRWLYQEVRWDTWQCGTGASTDRYSEVGSFDLGPASPSCHAEPAAPVDKDKWIRYDGSALATPDESTTDPRDVDLWKGNFQAGWEMLPPEAADDLVSRLPADPAAALRLIRTRSLPTRFASTLRLTPAQRDFAKVVGVFSTAPDLPQDKARTLYEVIRRLAGATEPVRVTDGAGRAVLAIGVEGRYRDASDERNGMQVLLSPASLAYRGVRYVAGLDYRIGGEASGGPFVAKGTVVATATRISTVLVDRAGQRP
ncbi:hypothetical protein [Streptomyces sp. NPDC059371]|uniref:hypothetical protein n=1 Tax=Streptomyces sp. NPDC059371 TaxID=3346812 RepID=UPI0036A2B8DA